MESSLQKLRSLAGSARSATPPAARGGRAPGRGKGRGPRRRAGPPSPEGSRRRSGGPRSPARRPGSRSRARCPRRPKSGRARSPAARSAGSPEGPTRIGRGRSPIAPRCFGPVPRDRDGSEAEPLASRHRTVERGRTTRIERPRSSLRHPTLSGRDRGRGARASGSPTGRRDRRRCGAHRASAGSCPGCQTGRPRPTAGPRAPSPRRRRSASRPPGGSGPPRALPGSSLLPCPRSSKPTPARQQGTRTRHAGRGPGSTVVHGTTGPTVSLTRLGMRASEPRVTNATAFGSRTGSRRLVGRGRCPCRRARPWHRKKPGGGPVEARGEDRFAALRGPVELALAHVQGPRLRAPR